MRRRILAILIVFMFLFTFAGNAHARTYYNFGEGDIVQKLNYAFSSGVSLVGNMTGVTTNVSTESNLTSAALAYSVIKLQAGSAKSIAIANGVAGQIVSIIMTVYDGKTITLTDDQVAAGTVTKTGWDDIAFSAVGHQVTLLYVDDTTGWIVIGYYGVTITQ